MLQSHTAEPVLVSTLKQLMAAPFLDNFYLVGGTGLALQIGHRNSIDIDLFTHTDYSPEILTEELTDFFEQKFPSLEVGQLLMSMHYFGDAEHEAMPKLYINTNWKKIKDSISQKIIAYLKK